MTLTSLLTVTDAARSFVADARSAEPDGSSLALFLEVTGAAGGSYSYDMWFGPRAEASASDAVAEQDDLSVVVLANSVDQVRGATLDLHDGGLVMINPNTPPLPAAERYATDLSSPLEVAVHAVLEGDVNPQIAAHGGRAELVGVHDNVAYLRLMGGCQGCGHASITLTQGIIGAIQSAVPEITDVVDVTAHAEGTSPYYAASGH